MTVAWLGTLGLVNALLFMIVVWVSVGTIRGQMLDTVALYGNGLARRMVGGPLDAALEAISVGSIALILVVIAVVAVARRRFALGVMAAAAVAWPLGRLLPAYARSGSTPR